MVLRSSEEPRTGLSHRPDPATNNAFLYCLIVAALRCQIDVLLPCAMSNHYHAVIYDRAGRYPELLEHFHKLLARSQNVLRGRTASSLNDHT